MAENDSLRHQGMRKKLVDGLKIKGIKDERVLAAIGKVPRHLFMESSFLNFAYKDQAFPIGAGQTISQPYTVAFQSQLLQIEKNDKILEIGTGSGYQAAVLLEMGARVFTVERQKELFQKVQLFLPEIGYRPACFFSDGNEGLPAFAPFDKILVTAGAPSIPEALKEQLKIGGRLVIPVGKENRQEMMTLIRVSEKEFKTEKHGGFVFVPLLKGTVNF
ncbi:protein-L-isoaspartate(D-aspartate) O-methyltransferase [Mariniphaga sediminis]|jgi:protein-L-isoaspartate(D-aspartate) O-methyltransferase|uniref:Protein-L-isoaspartate O-methyltransferase n=1 Tax=Mariniphaga sediminis TaxID=1628158 RepID=A0A399D502_9BACT|nr:protein-L-isoaspartate(D-aspartate) O-methyltransferase [Mariniphaga sediminis]RIH65742.1 protein-L-isoaspartate(D-aspartate) O-methyltransferase [Mariniphaga sediminis]